MKKFLFILSFLFFLVFNLQSATYYISGTAAPNGTGTALSPFNAWSSLPEMQTGDDVYFLCNSRFIPVWTLKIKWGGTAEDPAVIGAYYWEDNKVVHGVKGKRPIISGSAFAVPGPNTSGDYYGPLIRIDYNDYVEVRNLHIQQPGGPGIDVKADNNRNCDHFVIDNNYIEGAVTSGILVDRSPENYGQITNNVITQTSYGWYNELYDGHWGAAIAVTHCQNANTLIKGNYIHENWGYGIGLWCPEYPFTDAGYVTIEDNFIWNNHKADIYINGNINNIIRRNVCLGANDPVFNGIIHEERSWNQAGILIETRYISSDEFVPVNGNEVYNNLIAGHYQGISLETGNTNSELNDVLIYSNTVIGNAVNFSLGENFETASASGNIIRNNIFYIPTEVTGNNILIDPDWVDTKFIADHNAWSGSVPVYLGDASSDILLNESSFYSDIDWQNITIGMLETIVDYFNLLPEANVIDAGFTIGSPYDIDYDSIVRTVDEYDIGAFEFVSYTPPGLIITSRTLPDAEQNSIYNNTLSASGGTKPYSWSEVGANLPEGFILNSDGSITGTSAQIGEYEITARVTDNSGDYYDQILNLEIIPDWNDTTIIQINCGGGAVETFISDRYYIRGSLGYSTLTVDNSEVEDPAPMEVYQTARWGEMIYTISDLNIDSSYVVRLHFAETLFSGTGQRIFDVKINETMVLDNFDILAEGGRKKAVIREFNAIPDNDGRIVIEFIDAGPDDPMVCAIEVLIGEIENVSVKETEWNAITVYPNPASDRITIDGSGEQAVIELFTLSGIKVFQTEGDNYLPYTIDLDAFQSGMYIAVIRIDGKFYTTKIHKK